MTHTRATQRGTTGLLTSPFGPRTEVPRIQTTSLPPLKWGRDVRSTPTPYLPFPLCSLNYTVWYKWGPREWGVVHWNTKREGYDLRNRENKGTDILPVLLLETEPTGPLTSSVTTSHGTGGPCLYHHEPCPRTRIIIILHIPRYVPQTHSVLGQV